MFLTHFCTNKLVIFEAVTNWKPIGDGGGISSAVSYSIDYGYRDQYNYLYY